MKPLVIRRKVNPRTGKTALIMSLGSALPGAASEAAAVALSVFHRLLINAPALGHRLPA